MNCCKKTAVKNIHRSFYVIEFIMCRFPLIIIRCAWYFSAILKPFQKSLMAFASPAVKNGVLFARGSEPMHVFLPGFGTAW